MASDTPQIFFSYASEDKYWVEAFRKSVAFENVGAARVLDYAAEDVGFGDLREKLDERIERSAVIIAFVSADYLKKQWTVAEWESALTEAQRRRLVFVPIMLDADAVVWWKERRQQGGLTGLSRDYAYVSFIDAGGMRLDISPTDTLVNGKIARLAIQIRQELEAPLRSDLVAPSPSPAPPVNNASSGAGDAPDIVILGHPTAAFPPEIADPINQLLEGLKRFGLRADCWGNGWRKKPEARGKGIVSPQTIFVQPVAEGEAGILAGDLTIIGKYLGGAGFDNAKVALWLPATFSDPDFAEAAAKVKDPKQFPAVRADTTEGLTDWLQGFSDHAVPADETKIQIKTIGLSDDDVTGRLSGPQQLIEQLKSEFVGIATKFVDNPQPSPPPWEFWGDQFREHLRRLPGNRTIIAIHDLDVTPGSDGQIEKQLQARFDEILDAVEKEQDARAKAGKPRLNAFLAALLVRSAAALPFNEYPYDGRYGQWRLLGFAAPNGSAAGGASPLRPNPDSLAVFKQKLYSWAHTSRQPLQ